MIINIPLQEPKATIELSPEDARTVYNELRKIFEQTIFISSVYSIPSAQGITNPPTTYPNGICNNRV